MLLFILVFILLIFQQNYIAFKKTQALYLFWSQGFYLFQYCPLIGTNPNTLNSMIQVFESSCFFNDDDNFMLKPTKQINLYRFKIHILDRKLALQQEFCINLFFIQIYFIMKK